MLRLCGLVSHVFSMLFELRLGFMVMSKFAVAFIFWFCFYLFCCVGLRVGVCVLGWFWGVGSNRWCFVFSICFWL